MYYWISQRIRYSLYTNAIYLLGVNVIPGIAGFIFWIIAGKFYQPYDVGFASATISAATLIAGISGLNLSMGLIRFLAEAPNPIRMMNSAYCVNFIISILAAVVYLLGVRFWSPGLLKLRDDWLFFIIFIVYVIIATLGTIVRDTFVARRKSVYAFYYTIINNFVRVALVVIGFSIGAIGIIGANVIGFLISVYIAFVVYLSRIEPRYKFMWIINREDLGLMLPYSIGNYVAGLLLMLPQTILPLLTLNTMGPIKNGYAYIALMIGSTIATPSLAFAVSAFAEGSSDPGNSQKYLVQSLIIGMMITIPLTVIVIVFAPRILQFFGKDYALEATNLLRLLSTSTPFVAFTQLFFIYLRIKKQLLPLIIYSGLVGLFTIGTSAALMESLGILAIGIGVLGGNLIVAIVILIHVFHIHKQSKTRAIAVRPASTLGI